MRTSFSTSNALVFWKGKEAEDEAVYQGPWIDSQEADVAVLKVTRDVQCPSPDGGSSGLFDTNIMEK